MVATVSNTNNNIVVHTVEDYIHAVGGEQQQPPYDVIFVGDDLVALWAGNVNRTTTTTTTTSPRSKGSRTNNDHHHQYALHQYFQQTFTKDGGGDVNGLALGIAGDTVRFTYERDRVLLKFVFSFLFSVSPCPHVCFFFHGTIYIYRLRLCGGG
jgi:hypothetical protein